VRASAVEYHPSGGRRSVTGTGVTIDGASRPRTSTSQRTMIAFSTVIVSFDDLALDPITLTVAWPA
jgi:hypothetical protein